MLFSVEGAIELIKNFEQRITNYNGIEIDPLNIHKAVEFLTNDKAVRYYKDQGKVPTLRTLGKIALDFELGMNVDEDTLHNETERPAY